MSYDEEKNNDYYDRDYEPEAPKPPKPPKYPNTDPRYWDGEAPRWEHLRVSRRRRIYIWLGLALLVVAFAIAFYLRYLRPYVTEGVEYGYIENIEHRGTLFHTYEGTLLPYRSLMDSTRVYQRDFLFTAKDAAVGADIKRLELRHVPVRVEYEKYHATLPWRGDAKIVVLKVQEVDPRQLLPPDRQPEIMK